MSRAPQPLLDALTDLLQTPDDELPLDRAALLVASAFQPELDMDVYLSRIDLLADQASRKVRSVIGSRLQLAELREFLFIQEGFRGNREAYYDPRNAFLSEVLDRKLGIPVSLGILYMEVARRLELQMDGVGLPGHFIVRHEAPEGEFLIDPYTQGTLLAVEDCEHLIRSLYGEQAQLDERYLKPISRTRVLKRLLSHLKGVYLHAGNKTQAITTLDLALTVDPTFPDDLKARGLLYLELECFHAAQSDLERYLALETDAPDAGRIKTLLSRARGQIRKLN